MTVWGDSTTYRACSASGGAVPNSSNVQVQELFVVEERLHAAWTELDALLHEEQKGRRERCVFLACPLLRVLTSLDIIRSTTTELAKATTQALRKAVQAAKGRLRGKDEVLKPSTGAQSHRPEVQRRI